MSGQFSGQKLNSCNHECPLQWPQTQKITAKPYFKAVNFQEGVKVICFSLWVGNLNKINYHYNELIKLL